MSVNKIRTYTELITRSTYEERLQYLMLYGKVAGETFGFDRYLNQRFYKSLEWRKVRDFVIMRDRGCDLALKGYEIEGKVYVHHMNPLTIEDIGENNEMLFNPDFLVCVSHETHNAIHYGIKKQDDMLVIERSPDDTSPWKRR